MITENVKGFRDFTGDEAENREEIRKILVESFKQYGFEPAETPVVEYEEFVKGDNASDEAVSDVYKLTDKGDRKLALRYEFTFQLKRLMAGKKLPYKRYSIGPVFRDEPTTGNRFRQFVQCDIDTVGSTVKDEAEVLAAVNRILNKLGLKFTIYINNRKLMNEILEKENIDKMDWNNVIKEIDKLDKNDRDEIYNNLRGYGAANVLEIFEKPASFFEKYESYKEVKELMKYCEYFGVKVTFLPSLARGLSYYNGSVYEVKTTEMKETITAGGSFMFNNIQCTGLSFGLDRLSKLYTSENASEKIMILSIGEDQKAIEVTEKLRDAGKDCIFSSDKISKALDYANSKGIGKVVFVGSEEVKQDKIKVRDMKTGDEKMTKLSELVKESK
jgi:histidyl-tRNA synthetase